MLTNQKLPHPLCAILVSFALLLQTFSAAAATAAATGGQDWVPPVSDSAQCTTCERKYIFGVPPVLLEEIKVTGAITNAGLHYVPKGTDLVTLLVAAGGLRADATNNVYLKRGERVYEFNSDDLFRAKRASVKLESQDLVYVPQEKGFLNEHNVRLLTVIVSTLALSLAAFSIARR